MKCVFHVKPNLRRVRRARIGEAPPTSFDLVVDMGRISLETNRFDSTQSSGSSVDQLQVVASIIASA